MVSEHPDPYTDLVFHLDHWPPMKRLILGFLLAASSTWVLAQSRQQPQWQFDPVQKPAAAQGIERPSGFTDANSDWIPCAREGQTCYTPGPAQVRFGGEGRYSAPQNAVGHVECDFANFGDPARRMEKMCEYKLGLPKGTPRPAYEANNPDWVDCAKEGDVCRFRGTRLVRFGIEGAYYYSTETAEVMCSTSEFGDPARRIPKTCQVKRDALDRGDGRPGRAERGDRRGGSGGMESRQPSNNWVLCAVEGETCRVTATTMVRFGRDGDYNYRNTDNEVVCAPYEFGSPAQGKVRLCEANTIPPERSAERRPEPSEIPPLDDARWKPCAVEGQTCNFRGGEHVRYGGIGVYRVMFARDGLRCDSATFGGDPVKGLRKRCDVYQP